MGIKDTRFVGYDCCRHRSLVLGLLANGKPVDFASAGEDVDVILDETPFYGEMGGQVGDSGEIRSEHGTVSVSQTVRPLPELIVHRGKVTRGRIAVKDDVEAEVDVARRLGIARNHTATHLLQSALRTVLGQHVRQSGSLVNPDGFRFDFTHPEAVGKERLVEVQRLVNEKIRQDLPVVARSTSYGEAVQKGAIALFGEKYGDVVRVTEIGDPPFSIELCGGTHVHATGEIGLLHITAEGSIGSGLRRVEAVTGEGAERFLEQRLAVVEALSQELQAPPDGVQGKVSAVLADLDRERKRAMELERELAKNRAGSLAGKAVDVGGIRIVAEVVPNGTPDGLREMGDQLRGQLGRGGVVVLGTVHNDRPIFMATVTPDLVGRGFHAGNIVKQVAKIAGGGGGGKAEMGQGSGKDKAKIDEAVGGTVDIVSSHHDREPGPRKGKVD